MIKLKDCKAIADASNKDFKQFELYITILMYTDNKKLNKLYNKIKGYNTIKLESKRDNSNYCIIHKSTKLNDIVQVSYFNNSGAYADAERNSYKDALKEVYKSYTLKEAM